MMCSRIRYLFYNRFNRNNFDYYNVSFEYVYMYQTVTFNTLFSVPVCSVPTLDGGINDVSNCLSHNRCKVGTTIRYICEPGFVASATQTTKCQDDHTWSSTPSCVKGFFKHGENFSFTFNK